jgi:hypothetical protein
LDRDANYGTAYSRLEKDSSTLNLSQGKIDSIFEFDSNKKKTENLKRF